MPGSSSIMLMELVQLGTYEYGVLYRQQSIAYTVKAHAK